MSSNEKYAEKIAKLLSKAESTTPEEAELLLDKATQLMAQYAIDEAMIDAARGIERDEIVKEGFEFEGTYRHANMQLLWELCQKAGCRGVQSDWGDRRQLTFYCIGFKSDIDRIRMIHTSVQIQCAQALNAWWKATDTSWMDRNRKFAARREFIFGYGRGLGFKLATAWKKAEAEYQATTGDSSSVEIVLRSRKERVDEWVDGHYGGSLRSVSRNYKSGGYEARAAGTAAGRNADVGQGGLGSRKAIAS
jgi:hypothetical protein